MTVSAATKSRSPDGYSAAIGELTAQGATPEAARLQADGEFRERFAYTKAAQKK